MPRNLHTLEKEIGYTFHNPAFLKRALTRLAYTKEQGMPGDSHMDALATLGDAVIDLIVIKFLIDEGEHDKGIITNRKTNKVNMTELRKLAERLKLSDYVLWGKGEKEQHIWTSGRVLAECFESLLGAVYLDSGIEPVMRVLQTLKYI
jgi:ribonuclease-3